MRRCHVAPILLGIAACLFAPQPAVAASPWCTVSAHDARRALAANPSYRPLPDRPSRALADIHSGGIAGQGNWDTVIAATQDWVQMRRAALAWRAGAGDAQFRMARRLMLAWIDTYRPTLDPIDETDFDRLIDTFAILQDHLNAADRARVRTALNKWGWAYVDSIRRFSQPNYSIWINNWQSHRIKLITLFAAATGDDALFAEARRLFRLQIAANMHPDGETLDFAVRDALHYTVYDLEPLLRAALVARRISGEDWYRWETPDHTSLARAVAWLTPYASGTRTHEEFVHSEVDFDAERAAAGMKGYKGPFDVHDAAPVYWLASRFDATLMPLARSLGTEPDYLALCGG
jgi:hypothetical protein